MPSGTANRVGPNPYPLKATGQLLDKLTVGSYNQVLDEAAAIAFNLLHVRQTRIEGVSRQKYHDVITRQVAAARSAYESYRASGAREGRNELTRRVRGLYALILEHATVVRTKATARLVKDLWTVSWDRFPQPPKDDPGYRGWYERVRQEWDAMVQNAIEIEEARTAESLASAALAGQTNLAVLHGAVVEMNRAIEALLRHEVGAPLATIVAARGQSQEPAQQEPARYEISATVEGHRREVRLSDGHGAVATWSGTPPAAGAVLLVRTYRSPRGDSPLIGTLHLANGVAVGTVDLSGYTPLQSDPDVARHQRPVVVGEAVQQLATGWAAFKTSWIAFKTSWDTVINPQLALIGFRAAITTGVDQGPRQVVRALQEAVDHVHNRITSLQSDPSPDAVQAVAEEYANLILSYDRTANDVLRANPHAALPASAEVFGPGPAGAALALMPNVPMTPPMSVGTYPPQLIEPLGWEFDRAEAQQTSANDEVPTETDEDSSAGTDTLIA